MMKTLLASLCLIAAPSLALADLDCKFDTFCKAGQECKVSEQALTVTARPDDLTFRMDTADLYKRKVLPMTDDTMIVAHLYDEGWEILTVGPGEQAQWTIGGPPDMASAFSYRGICTGDVM